MIHAPDAGTARRPRILVADDSRLMRRVLSHAVEAAGCEVVGQAADGDEALALCASLRPDAMTLDLQMPGTDGLAVLRALHDAGSRRYPHVPAVVVSAFSPSHGARAVDALAEGAFELVAKPGVGESLPAFAEELGRKLHSAAASSRRDRVPLAAVPAAAAPAVPARHVSRPSAARRGGRLVLIACSTGGPKALAELIPALPSRLGAGTLIVQHMPAGFTASLAARLDRASGLTVREATGGEAIEPGVALLAPGGSHLRLAGDRAVELSGDDPIGGLRPRADLTIADAARRWGDRLLLVVLTGMGKDGLEGAHEVRRHGGRVLVEAESTCTVYGMPRAVAEADLADAVLPLSELPAAIIAEAAE